MSANKTPTERSKLVLVTGDPICDHNYYKGKRPTADSKENRGFQFSREGGGALLLKKLIANVMDGEADWKVEFGLNEDFETLPSAYHSFCFWEPQDGPTDDDSKNSPQFWRTQEPPLGYGPKKKGDEPDELEPKLRSNAYEPRKTPCAENPDVVVIDDAGIGFRSAEPLQLCSLGKDGEGKHSPRWVVLKLTGPIGSSPLWDEISDTCQDNLVVIVPAEELRRREVRLSHGLSWEATVEDLTAELHANPRLTPLLKARHLIVTFQFDAAYWLDNAPGAPKSMLVFDALRAEGDWEESQGEGSAFGFLSCFTAAVVKELCLAKKPDEPDFETALETGLGAVRKLRLIGHGPVIENDKEPKPGFPFPGIAAEIRNPVENNPDGKFVSVPIPHKVCAKGTEERYKRGHWMMLDEWLVHAHGNGKPQPHYDAAMAVAILGTDALERFPVAQFGSYLTVDRREIESLRTIRQLINNYKQVKKQKTPLNLGVFGPPGSGKSYIVGEIAEAVGIEKENVKVFNLSQFNDPADLFGAFHQVRDMILKGSTPLVFWDEFDAQGYRWLQYLLAPMEDGEFQDGQITHPIGKCIFFFAGATSSTFDKFGPPNPDGLSDVPQEMDKAWRAFVLAKGPDFKSRLVGYLNILGVNRKLICEEKDGRRVWSEDEKDLCFPIRRALFMRGLFKVETGQRLELDPHVIRALLEMPKFKGGGRSLEFLCKHLKNSCAKPGRSNLPGYELLDMHVKADLFWELCERDMEFISKAEELAVYLHEAYRLRSKDNPKKKHLDVPLAELSEDLQKANIAQALRIPCILRLAKMHLESGPVVEIGCLVADREANLVVETPIRQALTETNNLELLSEAEHNGWMVERRLSGWTYGREKNDDKKCHDCLIPYSQLTEYMKTFDRWTIVGNPAPAGKPNEEQFGYVDIVKTVGLRVVMDEKITVPSIK